MNTRSSGKVLDIVIEKLSEIVEGSEQKAQNDAIGAVPQSGEAVDVRRSTRARIHKTEVKKTPPGSGQVDSSATSPSKTDLPAGSGDCPPLPGCSNRSSDSVSKSSVIKDTVEDVPMHGRQGLSTGKAQKSQETGDATISPGGTAKKDGVLAAGGTDKPSKPSEEPLGVRDVPLVTQTDNVDGSTEKSVTFVGGHELEAGINTLKRKILGASVAGEISSRLSKPVLSHTDRSIIATMVSHSEDFGAEAVGSENSKMRTPKVTSVGHDEEEKTGPASSFRTKGTKEVYHCAKPLCGYSSHNKNYLKQHVSLVHIGERPFKCPLCNYAGKRSHALREHLLVHSSHRPYTCTFCNASFRKKAHLTSHVRMHSSHTHPCGLCPNLMFSQADLYVHIRKEHPAEALACKECFFATLVDSELTEHAHKHAASSQQAYLCNQCPFTSNRVDGMEQHLQRAGHGLLYKVLHSATQGTPKQLPLLLLKCSECGYTTDSKNELKAHMWTHVDLSAEPGQGHTQSLMTDQSGVSQAPGIPKQPHLVQQLRLEQAAQNPPASSPRPNLPRTISTEITGGKEVVSSGSPIKVHSDGAAAPKPDVTVDLKAGTDKVGQSSVAQTSASAAGAITSSSTSLVTVGGGTLSALSSQGKIHVTSVTATATANSEKDKPLLSVEDAATLGQVATCITGIQTGGRYLCSQCEFACNEAYAFITHMLSHKPLSQGQGIKSSSAPSPVVVSSHVTMTSSSTVPTVSTAKPDTMYISPTAKSSVDPEKRSGVYQCRICGYVCRNQRTIKAHIWKHSGHRDIDYPIFQNGPLSVYDDVPTGISVLVSSSSPVTKRSPLPLDASKVLFREVDPDKAPSQVLFRDVTGKYAKAEPESGSQKGSEVDEEEAGPSQASLGPGHLFSYPGITNQRSEEGSAGQPSSDPDHKTISHNPGPERASPHPLNRQASLDPNPERLLSDPDDNGVAANQNPEPERISPDPEYKGVSPDPNYNGVSTEPVTEHISLAPERNKLPQGSSPRALNPEESEEPPPRKRSRLEETSDDTAAVISQVTSSGNVLGLHVNTSVPEMEMNPRSSPDPAPRDEESNATDAGPEAETHHVPQPEDAEEQEELGAGIPSDPAEIRGHGAEDLAQEDGSENTDHGGKGTHQALQSHEGSKEPEMPTVMTEFSEGEGHWSKVQSAQAEPGEMDQYEVVLDGEVFEVYIDNNNETVGEVVVIDGTSQDSGLEAGERHASEEELVEQPSPGLRQSRNAKEGDEDATKDEEDEDEEEMQTGISRTLLEVIEQVRSRCHYTSESESRARQIVVVEEEVVTLEHEDALPKQEEVTAAAGDACSSSDDNVEEEDGVLRCKLCFYTSNSLASIKTHMKMHKVREPNECCLCNFIAPSSDAIQRHMFKHCKARTFSCKRCDATFNYKSELRAHIKEHNRKLSYSCRMCQYVARDMQDFSSHVSMVHKQESMLVKCDECGERVSISTAGTDAKVRITSCTMCGAAVIPDTDTDGQRQRRCQNKNYKCAQCSYVSRNYNEMRAHLRSHIEGQELNCSMCDFVAVSLRSLKSHMKRHINDQRFVQQPLEQYKCQLCGYLCHHLPALKSHMWRHSTDTTYSYHITNDLLNAAIDGDIADPEQTTSGIPLGTHVTFRCVQCGFETSDRTALNDHVADEHYEIVKKTIEVNRDQILPESTKPC